MHIHRAGGRGAGARVVHRVGHGRAAAGRAAGRTARAEAVVGLGGAERRESNERQPERRGTDDDFHVGFFLFGKSENEELGWLVPGVREIYRPEIVGMMT